jgi:glycosyltransferase involved in cell wall biosynthesis
VGATALEAGYELCLVSGILGFYVHPAEAGDLAVGLSYPAHVHDSAFCRIVFEGRRLDSGMSSVSRRAEEPERAVLIAPAVDCERSALERRNAELAAELQAIRATVSWRITRPLRALRRAQLRIGQRRRASSDVRDARTSSARRRNLDLAFAARIGQAVDTLLPGAGVEGLDPGEAMAGLEAALGSSTAPDRAKAWLSLVAVDGCFPAEQSVETVVRTLRMEGPARVRQDLLDRFGHGVECGKATMARLDVRSGRVVVDVTHTVSHDLHTGVQRVVRETATRWMDSGHRIDLVHFDFSAGALKRLSSAEYRRMTEWREHLGRSGDKMTVRLPEEATGDVVVPWRSQVVLPELVAEPERCSAYRVLASTSVLESLSLIGYDLIPVVAAETVTDGMSANYARYLSLVKHADRVSAISRASADGFRGFREMVASEGLRGPEVAAHPLPAEVPSLQPGTVEEARRTLGIGSDPMILVVGSHEPRKNHVAVLEAAEQLWRSGARFELLFLGGSGWKGERFDELVSALSAAGRLVSVRKRCSEDELWAAYSLARFSVFPSLLEGFGLPVAESLAMGTPVIASEYGSMAEIADGGGCLLVDPRDVDSLAGAMSRLLEDDQLLDCLRREAAARPSSNWENYATDVWSFLVG